MISVIGGGVNIGREEWLDQPVRHQRQGRREEHSPFLRVTSGIGKAADACVADQQARGGSSRSERRG